MIPYKDDNPAEAFPYVTVIIIAINTIIYVFFVGSGHEAYWSAILNLGTIPYEVWYGVNIPESTAIHPYLSLFTSMFMHADFFHLAGNMLYLWIFGNNVEDYFGGLRFVLFYLVCGFAADFTHIVLDNDSIIPCIGSSGAISGILGAYFVLYPRARVRVLFLFYFYPIIIKAPAFIMLFLWFMMQALLGIPSLVAEGGGVGYWAHIGGFAAGFLWLWSRKVLLKRPKPAKIFSETGKKRK